MDSNICAGSTPAPGTKKGSRAIFFNVMASVYVLYSNKLDRFYIGSCKEFQFRFEQHLSKVYTGGFTSRADDWQLFLLMEDLSYSRARAIERHIKKMKSREYIQNLMRYPGMINKLRDRTFN